MSASIRRCVKRLVFEIVPASKTFERFTAGIREERDVELFVKILQSLLELLDGFGADRDDVETGLLVAAAIGENSCNCSTQCRHPKPR